MRSAGANGPPTGTAHSSQRGARGSLDQTERHERGAGSSPMRYRCQRSSTALSTCSITDSMMDLDASAGWVGSGLGRDGSHEELEPDQTFVKLAQRLPMTLIVQPDSLEQRRVEVLQRPEVIAVSRRDFGDESSRFARPGV